VTVVLSLVVVSSVGVSLDVRDDRTPTVTVASALPPGPVQLRLKADRVVSGAVGSSPATVFCPLQAPEAAQSVASSLVQLSSVGAPLVTVAGDALSVTRGTG
jgi:hypothetical protein